ncbi:DUF4465 domain-containing protein [Roseiconus lacunae]|uniref:DUF4465 domain-containing protein n=1 Tax=Roseiconus lacunae TaxID=2605694 RepID=A0ABT7PIH8_9BACT|nr:DUF4465 domain-containing protein [Roseiconus lacunae]MCD0458414.1 DUF4465 domain-containing protein [Roseiconus lacunae]MDM4016302.1 DUF4465 domain-containing protein [Roseiconus lacunae]
MKCLLTPIFAITCCLTLMGQLRAETVVDFEELNGFDAMLPIAGSTQFYGSGHVFNGYGQDAPIGSFSSQGVSFETAPYGPGFSYSRFSNSYIPGFLNQFSALPGGGSDGAGGTMVGGTYGMVYTGASTTSTGESTSSASLSFDAPVDLISIDITNATYAALYFRDGLDGLGLEPDSAHQFSTGDYLSLTLTGFDDQGGVSGSTTIDLARFEGSIFDTDDYIEGWETVDLSGFGSTSSLAFSIESSDFDPQWGLNIPAYAAIDNLRFVTAVPEPSSFALLTMALSAFAIRRRR